MISSVCGCEHPNHEGQRHYVVEKVEISDSPNYYEKKIYSFIKMFDKFSGMNLHGVCNGKLQDNKKVNRK